MEVDNDDVYEIVDHVEEGSDDEEGEEKPTDNLNKSSTERDICTICLEDYTTTGDHRPASLKCGHIFGLECIKRWISSKDRNPSCPQCNAKTRMFQVRILYFSNVKLVDTIERDAALKSYENEKKLRETVELEYHDLRGKYESLNTEFIHIKEQLKALESKNSNITRDILKAALVGNAKTVPQGTLDGYSGKYIVACKYNISSEAKNRSLGISPFNNQLYVTDYVTSPLVNSWGIKKIAKDFKSFKFTSLHSEMIRGMTFPKDPTLPYVITAGADKKVRLTNLSNDQIGLTMECPTQVWSVAWNDDGPDGFFAGCSTGAILLFDLRVPSKPLHTFNPAKHMVSAVHSLNYIPRQGNGFQGGILIGQLNGFSFIEADKSSNIRESDHICSFTREASSSNNSTIASHNSVSSSSLSSFLPSPATSRQTTTNSLETLDDNEDLFADENTSVDDQNQNNQDELFEEVCGSWPKFNYRGLASQNGLVSLSTVLVNDEIHFLNSYRSGASNAKVRHLVNRFLYFADSPTSNSFTQIHSLTGGTQHVPIFKSRIFCRGDDAKVCAISGDQGTNSALLWRCDTGDLIQQFNHPAIYESNPVIDAVPLDSSGRNLALLTKKDLLIYEWNKSCK